MGSFKTVDLVNALGGLINFNTPPDLRILLPKLIKDMYKVLFPFLSEARPLAEDLHNEFLEIFNAFSVIGLLMFYFVVISFINSFKSQFRAQAISLLLIIFVGGITVSNLLHPYTSIIIAYYIAFYYVLSSKQN